MDSLWEVATTSKGGALAALAAIAVHRFYSNSKLRAEVTNTHPGTGTLFESASLLALFVFSHFICYYLWWAAEFNQGCLGNPFPLAEQVFEKAMPNRTSVCIYMGLIVWQLLLSAVMPGVTVLGFKIPQENNRRLAYKCNALAGWYLTVALAATAHMTDTLDLKLLHRNSGALLTTAIVFADLLAVAVYLECCRTNRCDGSWTFFGHDFVMGQYLNPRIRIKSFWNSSDIFIDLKMWAEIRVSWLLLFALDVSCALCLKEELGYVPNRIYIVLLIHGLYTNACMKGEESIPYTWDIFQECWGWMLIYWNLAGVALTYTFNGRFIYAQATQANDSMEDLPTWAFVSLAVSVVIAYWIFDSANAQKNRFRAQKLAGAWVERPWAFPQVPWATLHNPKFMTTKSGSTLLVDGWWQYVRKPHYTADFCLALLLCLPCGFQHFLPYFFACFFCPMLIHRALRDNHRCAIKYGKDWDEYCQKVPYLFIPGIC